MFEDSTNGISEFRFVLKNSLRPSTNERPSFTDLPGGILIQENEAGAIGLMTPRQLTENSCSSQMARRPRWMRMVVALSPNL